MNNSNSNAPGSDVDFVIEPAGNDHELVEVTPFFTGSTNLTIKEADYRRGAYMGGLPHTLRVAYESEEGKTGGVAEYVYVADAVTIGSLRREIDELRVTVTRRDADIEGLRQSITMHAMRPFHIRVWHFLQDLWAEALEKVGVR